MASLPKNTFRELKEAHKHLLDLQTKLMIVRKDLLLQGYNNKKSDNNDDADKFVDTMNKIIDIERNLVVVSNIVYNITNECTENKQ